MITEYCKLPRENRHGDLKKFLTPVKPTPTI
jgi:hypothetical protein